MRHLLAAVIAGICAALPAAAQERPAPSPEPDYTINAPSEDVAAGRAEVLQQDTDPRIALRAVERFSLDPDQFTQTDGQALYRTSCQACHMEDGKGAAGAGHYPPLAGNAKMVSKYYILSVLLNGYHGMPRFGDQMDNAQIAAVSNYVRENFGNAFPDTITPDDVQKLRSGYTD